jgi:L,D-peptidoglycan transpeptidase YkuD (ErfK/YbiS/YcfS/YnhG family)
MSNKKDEGCVTIFKLKLRQLIEAIERGATVEQVKTELEKMLT